MTKDAKPRLQLVFNMCLFIFSPSHNTGALELPRIQQEHGGYYTCVAKNTGSSENITYEVTVSGTLLIYKYKHAQVLLAAVQLRLDTHSYLHINNFNNHYITKQSRFPLSGSM